MNTESIDQDAMSLVIAAYEGHNTSNRYEVIVRQRNGTCRFTPAQLGYFKNIPAIWPVAVRLLGELMAAGMHEAAARLHQQSLVSVPALAEAVYHGVRALYSRKPFERYLLSWDEDGGLVTSKVENDPHWEAEKDMLQVEKSCAKSLNSDNWCSWPGGC